MWFIWRIIERMHPYTLKRPSFIPSSQSALPHLSALPCHPPLSLYFSLFWLVHPHFSRPPHDHYFTAAQQHTNRWEREKERRTRGRKEYRLQYLFLRLRFLWHVYQYRGLLWCSPLNFFTIENPALIKSLENVVGCCVCACVSILEVWRECFLHDSDVFFFPLL